MKPLTEALRNRYVVESVVALGGMATVYLARDLKHDRPVALKVMRADLAACLGPDRFQREIRLVARLQHPNILTVLDSGEAAGQPWFTMPFVQGESLRGRLRRQGRLPVAEALRITREAAGALGYAHRHGIVHRDVKPENLLLMEDGTTLLADFGVALPVAQSKEDHFTETGLSIGTPAYIAPEQATGQAVDGRADQYGLAATCYEMLTGVTPFTGATAAAIIAQRFTRPVQSTRLARPEVPVRLDQALLVALELEPGDRFNTMDEFAGALAGDAGAAADTASTESPTVTIPAHRSRPPMSAAARVLRWLLVLGLGAQRWAAGSGHL